MPHLKRGRPISRDSVFLKVRAWPHLEIGPSWGIGKCQLSRLDPISLGMFVTSNRINYKMKDEWGPEQRISLEDAILHWTIDSANALKMEDEIGSLEVGKQADLVLWNHSPLKLNSWWFLLTHDVELGKLEDLVDLTVVGGEIVYEKGS